MCATYFQECNEGVCQPVAQTFSEGVYLFEESNEGVCQPVLKSLMMVYV